MEPSCVRQSHRSNVHVVVTQQCCTLHVVALFGHCVVLSTYWDQLNLYHLFDMPRSRRRHRSRSHSRTHSHSAGSPQYEHKRRRIDYESPQSKGTYSGERVLRSRQHERGTSQERRYKRSHRRSPSSGRQHGHRDRDRDRAHLVHPTSSRRARIHRHHGTTSPSQERHRHRSPSSRSQVSPRVSTIVNNLTRWPSTFHTTLNYNTRMVYERSLCFDPCYPPDPFLSVNQQVLLYVIG